MSYRDFALQNEDKKQRRHDLSGQLFGKWKVIEFYKIDKGGNAWFLCECECGRKRPVKGSGLKSGHSKSCGGAGCKCKKTNPSRIKIIDEETALVEIKKRDGMALYTKISPEDIDLVKDDRWYKSFVYVFNTRQTKNLARLIMNCPEDKEVDHINHDPLDNRRGNLRICNRYENSRNTRARKDNKSGYKNVHDKNDGTYTVQIRINKKIISVTRIKKLKDAVDIANALRKKFHKGFAIFEEYTGKREVY